jgi:hypothetical protein
LDIPEGTPKATVGTMVTPWEKIPSALSTLKLEIPVVVPVELINVVV